MCTVCIDDETMPTHGIQLMSDQSHTSGIGATDILSVELNCPSHSFVNGIIYHSSIYKYLSPTNSINTLLC